MTLEGDIDELERLRESAEHLAALNASDGGTRSVAVLPTGLASEPLVVKLVVGSIIVTYYGMLILGTALIYACGGKDWLEKETKR